MSGGAIEVASRATSRRSTSGRDVAGARTPAARSCSSGPFATVRRRCCRAARVLRLRRDGSKVLREIAEEAAEKWALAAVAIEHGVGDRAAGEITFVVVVLRRASRRSVRRVSVRRRRGEAAGADLEEGDRPVGSAMGRPVDDGTRRRCGPSGIVRDPEEEVPLLAIDDYRERIMSRRRAAASVDHVAR